MRKNVNAVEVTETAKSSERIFGDLIWQLLGEIPGGKINDLAKIEVQQILVKQSTKLNPGECKMRPKLTYSMSHQHMFWYHPVNPFHHEFNLKRLTRSNTR